MKTGAWHSSQLLDKYVYHDNTSCTEGATVMPTFRKPGSVGRPKCARCTQLNSAFSKTIVGAMWPAVAESGTTKSEQHQEESITAPAASGSEA